MRSREPEQLSIFVGKWHTQGRITAPGEPTSQIDSSDIYEWVAEKHFVMHRWDSRIGEATASGIEMIGPDSTPGHFRTHFFDNGGNVGSETLTLSGRTWTWLGKDVMGAKFHRCTSVVSEDGDTMTARHERSEDGAAWAPWMEVTLRRIG